MATLTSLGAVVTVAAPTEGGQSGWCLVLDVGVAMPSPRHRTVAASCVAAIGAGGLPAVVGSSVLSTAWAPPVAADLSYNPYPGPWNGKKIYLSPARHKDAGGRGECNGNNENNIAFGIALNAVTYLTSSGYNYQVHVGNGTLQSAISNSNAWGSNAHLPLHSNARNEVGGCANTTASVHGTNTIYRAGVGTSQLMAQKLLDNLGPQTPGTNDFICYNPGQPCTTINLGELGSVSAPYRAYSEVEYHTWTTGTNWLTGSAATAGFKITLAVYTVV